MTGHRKQMAAVVDAAVQQGWRAVTCSTGHVRLLAPNGRTQVSAPTTPSDWRSVKNTISQMRRGGFRWKGH